MPGCVSCHFVAKSLGKENHSSNMTCSMLLGQWWDWKLLVTKSTCKSYCWVVCATDLFHRSVQNASFYHSMWSARVCANPKHLYFPEKRLIHIVSIKDLVQCFYAGHLQEAEVVTETVSLKMSVAFLSLLKIKNLNCFTQELRENGIGNMWSWNGLFCWLIQQNKINPRWRINCKG